MAGGLTTAPTPNEWHTEGENSEGQLYMSPDGTTRANEARTFYNDNAGTGYK